jgi:hypothetical protein
MKRRGRTKTHGDRPIRKYGSVILSTKLTAGSRLHVRRYGFAVSKKIIRGIVQSDETAPMADARR